MLMIGVIPLPALTNSSRSGTSSGSTKVPSTPPRRTIVPGLASRTRYGVTAPLASSFGVMLMKPSGRAWIRGDRVRAPVVLAVDLEADRAGTGPACAPPTPSPA